MQNNEGFRSRADFLEHAQAESGGYYRHITTREVLEFVRPCSDSPEGYFMRMRRLDDNAKMNVDFLDLVPVPEMELLALVIDSVDKKAEAPKKETSAPARKFDIIERLFGPDEG